MPDNLYNKDNQNPIIYDTSYNIALRNKLEDDYTKKYVKQINKNYSVDTSPFGAYSREVLLPYDLNKKTDNYKIIRKH